MENKLKSAALILFIIALLPKVGLSQTINIVYSSDAHYGIKRKQFKGDTAVAGYIVNAAMIKQINTLPLLTLPEDGGIEAGKKISAVDYLIQTGDIANRMEYPIQTAAASWAQFTKDYFQDVTLKGHDGTHVKYLLAPGNHDISNAIGFPKTLVPVTDPTSMVQIYNLMVKPQQPLTNQGYDYAADKINYSRNIGGIHFMFITLWPDSAERIWMQQDLAMVDPKMPVILFTHDEPDVEAKHFTNPVAPYQIKTGSKFECLLAEHYKEGTVVTKGAHATDIEQRGWVAFLKLHPNIKAYFHGNTNYNQFYVYRGPDNDVALNTFRVDSPMKGEVSSKDETKLSFQFIAIDPVTQSLTVRECLWDTNPTDPTAKIVFGESKTVSLKVD